MPDNQTTLTPEERTELKAELHHEWQRWMAEQERFPAGLQRLALTELNRLLSFPTSEELNSIARELNLTPQTRSHLGELMWGYALRHDAGFADTAAMAERLGVPPETAIRIRDEIKRRIFRVQTTPPKPPQPQISGNLVNLRPNQPSQSPASARYNTQRRQ